MHDSLKDYWTARNSDHKSDLWPNEFRYRLSHPTIQALAEDVAILRSRLGAALKTTTREAIRTDDIPCQIGARYLNMWF